MIENKFVTKKGRRPCTALFAPEKPGAKFDKYPIDKGYVLVRFEPEQPHHRPRTQLIKRSKLIAVKKEEQS